MKANFDAIESATYSEVKNSPESLPSDLLSVCANSIPASPTGEITIQADASGVVTSSQVSAQCGDDTVCIIPLGTTYQVDNSINLGALVVRGIVDWSDNTQVSDDAYLCAGYISVEGQGSWEMDVQVKKSFIYVKDNGYEHHHLRSRAFGR